MAPMLIISGSPSTEKLFVDPFSPFFGEDGLRTSGGRCVWPTGERFLSFVRFHIILRGCRIFHHTLSTIHRLVIPDMDNFPQRLFEAGIAKLDCEQDGER